MIDFEEAMKLPRREVMIIATGGQGEPRAALARIAFGQHKLALDPGDLVIFSSKQIPGNEIAIGRIQNELAARGIEMITDRQAPVHVSGHPGRPELAAMYDWIRPEMIVPVHGEMRHMMEQARFAKARGIPHGIVQKNGDLIRLAPNGPEKLVRGAGRPADPRRRRHPARRRRTMNERRRAAMFGLDLGRGRARRRRPAQAARSRSTFRAFRSRRIARPSSPRPATPPPTRSRRTAARTRTNCARPSASPSAAAPPNGPARSRSSAS